MIQALVGRKKGSHGLVRIPLDSMLPRRKEGREGEKKSLKFILPSPPSMRQVAVSKLRSSKRDKRVSRALGIPRLEGKLEAKRDYAELAWDES